MEADANNVHRLTTKIRRFICDGRKNHELRQDKADFSQLCSSLDVIEDSEQAIAAFQETDFGKNVALGYLATYGLLQSLFLQQDAVTHLCEALGVQLDRHKYPSLSEIREIRNASVGHPTKQGGKNRPRAFNHISQASMSREGFDLLTFKENGQYENKAVDLCKLIADQQSAIQGILHNVVETLEREDEMHKAAFRNEKLADLFPDTMSYYCEKVAEGVDGGVLGTGCLAGIKNAFTQFRTAALGRNPSMGEFFDHEYATILHAIDNLERFLGQGVGDRLTAHILVEHLSIRLNSIRAVAEQIDDEYASRESEA
jgi:hypothetical protein